MECAPWIQREPSDLRIPSWSHMNPHENFWSMVTAIRSTSLLIADEGKNAKDVLKHMRNLHAAASSAQTATES